LQSSRRVRRLRKNPWSSVISQCHILNTRLNGKRYAMLKCRTTQGWIDPANNNNVVSSDLTKKIDIECKFKACAKGLIRGTVT
ncbi:hypothetical protein PENTCL1PPCAC_25907, partial [Pristionchus entomophagus]